MLPFARHPYPLFKSTTNFFLINTHNLPQQSLFSRVIRHYTPHCIHETHYSPTSFHSFPRKTHHFLCTQITNISFQLAFTFYLQKHYMYLPIFTKNIIFLNSLHVLPTQDICIISFKQQQTLSSHKRS